MLALPKLLERAENGEVKFFLQFGGQGAPYLKELAQYYSEPKMQKFFELALSALSQAQEYCKESKVFPFPLKLKEWLSGKENPPSDEELAAAPYSLGLIQVTQLAHWEYLHQMGFHREILLKHTLAASGHSQGLITATFASLGLKGEAYEKAMSIYIQYLFLMGVRAQEVFPKIYPELSEQNLAESLGLKNPAPMVAVLGESHSFIEKFVEEFNESQKEKIYISLYNSPTNRIISGERKQILAFYERYKNLFQEKSVKFVFLRSTCPFHSPLMEPIKKPFAQDIEAIGFHFKGSDLKFPVYSFADGKNLQEEGELGLRLCDDLMVQTLYWEKALSVVARNPSITHILDFGPGKTTQRLSQETLLGLNTEKPILAVATPKDLKEILQSS